MMQCIFFLMSAMELNIITKAFCLLEFKRFFCPILIVYYISFSRDSKIFEYWKIHSMFLFNFEQYSILFVCVWRLLSIMPCHVCRKFVRQ